MNKEEVLKIIDEVMNNREIDSIRNAILAIRDKVIELEEPEENPYYAKVKLRGNNHLAHISGNPKNAEYLVIDTALKIDTNYYGAYWFE